MTKGSRTTRIIYGEDMAIVDAFFSTRPDINVSRFIHNAIVKAIHETWDNELQQCIDRVNEHQRLYGGQELK